MTAPAQDPQSQPPQAPPPIPVPKTRPGGLYIGTFLGIRFFLDYSWFFIAGILTWALTTQYFPERLPGLTDAAYLPLGALTAGLFFISILLHELGHSVVSQRCGIPVPRITLLFIGGVAEISKEPEDAISELKIALGGPAVSLVLAGIFFAVGATLSAMQALPVVVAMTYWLAGVNLVLLIFNAIPGYPLDGGRVLRALIWLKTGRYGKATFITSRIGIGFAWLLIAGGIFFMFSGNLFNGFLYIFIGLFLKNAAESGYDHAVFRDTLSNVTIREVMSRQVITISGDTPMNLVVDDFFLGHHHVAYPVTNHSGEFLGIIRLEYLKKLEKSKWPYTSAHDLVIENRSSDLWIDVETSANDALMRMSAPGEGRLAVLEKGKLIGFVTRHDLTKSLRIRKLLGEQDAE